VRFERALTVIVIGYPPVLQRHAGVLDRRITLGARDAMAMSGAWPRRGKPRPASA
jgi:hypothetical protein